MYIHSIRIYLEHTDAVALKEVISIFQKDCRLFNTVKFTCVDNCENGKNVKNINRT